MSKWRVASLLVTLLSSMIWPFMSFGRSAKTFSSMTTLERMRELWPLALFVWLVISIVWCNGCRRCHKRFVFAHPESDKVCRNCAIVQKLTGENPDDWNST